ncbi:MAG TPA: LPS assembly protein LptD [Sphingobium sp.]|nr:LPS assembly protein LptD [Sphingobium sp.]
MAPVGAAAQDTGAQPQEMQATPAETPPPVSGDEIGFVADELLYDTEREVVTASGNVVVRRDGNILRADSVTWDRKTGKVVARGDVAVTNPKGDTAYGDVVEVTESLRDGIVEGLLIVTREGDRIAANQGERRGPIFILKQAAYSPCAVVDEHGCPKSPTWQIRAARVVYDSEHEKVRYLGARIELFGLPLIPLPGLAHPVGTGGGSGLLVPDVGIDALNGAELSLPYYFSLAPNRDLKVTTHLYSRVWPMLEGTYRALVGNGAYQVTGFATYGRRSDPANLAVTSSTRAFRGYFDASGKFQLNPEWSVSGSLRRVTDRTFLNRYDISRDDRLRSTIAAERIGRRSYLSIAGWAFQTLRPGDPQGRVPLALPAIDYRLRLPDPWLGGTVQLQANSLAIVRSAGQDSQRAFVGGQWSLSRLTGMGQEIGLTAYLRGDVYHSAQNQLTATAIYRGEPGWQTRGIAAVAADVRWPFTGPLFGGTQHIVPRIQLVAAPRLSNLRVPNEDARSVDLEDSNLFALNRFPGYDRFEDSSRITYGVDYRFDRPHLAIQGTVGQSYRLTNRASILPQGTGLSERFSDFVGRVEIRYRDFVSLTHRFRLDKQNLAIRRNEIDATIGSRATYARISYLRLNRNVTANLEDLRDVEEMRLGGRIAFARNWSLFGSTTIDMTGRSEDPATLLDGYTPVRHRLGIAYQNDCVDLGLTWQREYQTLGDARRGSSFLVRLAFRNLGI